MSDLDLSVSLHIKRLLSFDLNFVARETVDCMCHLIRLPVIKYSQTSLS